MRFARKGGQREIGRIFWDQFDQALAEYIGFDGFCDVLVRSADLGAGFVEGLKGPGQEQNRYAEELRDLLDGFADRVAVDFGQAHVGQYDIRP